MRESKSNGAMESRVKSWQSQFRTMMFDLRKCINQKVPLLCNVTSWLVWWAATVLNKYKMDPSGRTPYQRITNVHQHRPIAKFGERVRFMVNGKRDPGLKGEPIMHEGIFLGIRNHGIECLIAVDDGVVAARTVRRKPEDERWSARDVLGIRASVGTNLNDGEEPQGAPSGGGVPLEPQRSENAEDIHEDPQHEPNHEPVVADSAIPEDETAEQTPPVRVRAEASDRVMFEDPPSAMDEVQSAADQSFGYSPTSPASSAGMEPDDNNMEAAVSPPPSRIRLRPLRNTSMESPPGSESSPATKAARTQDILDEGTLNQVRELRKKLDEEKRTEDQRMLMMVIKGVDIAEVFSPPRIAAMAQRMGFVAGSSMDLKTGWDFSRADHRRVAIETLVREKPWIVVGSPPCTAFSVIQNLNLHKFKDDENWMKAFEEKKRQAVEHVRFCMQLYKMQMQNGRYFLHEHPEGATSWDLEMVKEIEEFPGVHKVRCDQCQYGLVTTVKGETRPARKPTAFISNSWFVSNELTMRCSGDHEHFSLMEGRAKAAQEYPDKYARLCAFV